ncbi:hypothetical protein [Bradyrhizobium sp. CB1015]|uniref:hypothetical protein n=1 Tax=Bradyrhizobium sp. CB1015 TaxID=2976822 RepID=UPI0021A9BFFD|nr:hypothetical protein [Bradyrhizobium sp. CB1015]UWU89620.1 hypothetical protein N2604_24320 [Bradyrhizobium sp. CB1015]
MEGDKPSLAEGAIGPVQQFQLLLYATKDTELSACDLAVLAELADRFLKDGPKGGATRPTSAAHLAKETGRDDASTARSIAHLAERGYISIAEQGIGRRGNTYLLPFRWVRDTATAIYNYIKPLAQAKRRRRRAQRSDRTRAVSSGDTVATAPARSLRSFVTAPVRYLDGVATAPTRHQSYGLPMEGPIDADMSAGTYGVPPPVVTKKIVGATVETEDGESWLSLDFEEGGGDIIAVESADKDMQADGQRELELLCASAGLDEVNEPAELIGCRVYLRGGRYVLAPANDNGVADDEAA